MLWQQITRRRFGLLGALRRRRRSRKVLVYVNVVKTGIDGWMDVILSCIVLAVTSLEVWGKILHAKVLFCQRYERVLGRKIFFPSFQFK